MIHTSQWRFFGCCSGGAAGLGGGGAGAGGFVAVVLGESLVLTVIGAPGAPGALGPLGPLGLLGVLGELGVFGGFSATFSLFQRMIVMSMSPELGNHSRTRASDADEYNKLPVRRL
jgi:hypothetical protein